MFLSTLPTQNPSNSDSEESESNNAAPSDSDTPRYFLQRFVVSYLRSSLLWSRLSVAIEFGHLSSTSTCTVSCSASAFRRLSSSSSSTCIGCSASACLSSSPTWTCMFQLLKLVVSRHRLVLLVVFQLLKLVVSSSHLVFWSNISTLFKPFFKNQPVLLHLIPISFPEPSPPRKRRLWDNPSPEVFWLVG